MNTPLILSWPQIILYIIGFIGVALLISMGATIVRREYWHEHTPEEDDQVEHKHGYSSRHSRGHPYAHSHSRPVRWRRGTTGIVLLLLATSLLWLIFLTQTYLGLTGDIKVARVHATQTQIPHLMSVELILYGNDGRAVSDKTYIMQGDEWMVQGDFIKFPEWLNILGLHTGYKLTRLEGRYDDPDLERNSKHTVIVLNGGDDQFFKTVQQQAWTSPIVQAAYGNAVFLQADGKTYDVFVSQTGLYAKPAK